LFTHIGVIEILDTQTFSSKFQNLKPNFRILVMIVVSSNVRYMRLFTNIRRGYSGGPSIVKSVIKVVACVRHHIYIRPTLQSQCDLGTCHLVTPTNVIWPPFVIALWLL